MTKHTPREKQREPTYQNDRPISSPRRDDFRRNKFARTIASAVYDYAENGSLAIGLFGSWGSGKTSTLELFKLALQEYPEGFNAPLVLDFNPWRIGSGDELVLQFFKELTSAIDSMEKTRWGKSALAGVRRLPWETVDALDLAKTSELLAKYAVAVASGHAAAGPLGAVAGAAIIGGATVASATKVFLSAAKSGQDVERLKKLISKRLARLDRKIVIIIDDIDRLTVDEVRTVFQLVKAIADFDNVIYVLALDWEVVEAALGGVQGTEGGEYLKKIVQISIEMPGIDAEKLINLFVESFNRIVADYQGPLEQAHFNDVFLGAGAALLRSGRDISRVLNSYRFMYRLLRDEVNLIDLLGITLVAVSSPRIYYYIRAHQNLFCDSSALTTFEDELKREQDQYVKLVSEIPDDARSGVCETVNALFPKFAERMLGRNVRGHVQEGNWQRELRIAASVRFSTYFRYILADDDVTQSEIADLILKTPDEAALIEAARSLIRSKKGGAVIAELGLRAEQVPEAGVRPLFRMLQTLGGEIGRQPHRGDLYFIDNSWRIKRLSLLLLRRVDEGERHALILQTLEAAEGLPAQAALVNILDDIRRKFDGGNRAGPYDDPLIEKAELQELRHVLTEKIRRAFEEGSLVRQGAESVDRDVVMLFAIWRTWDGSDAVRVVVEPKLDDASFMQLIKLFTTPNHPSQTRGDMGVLRDIFGSAYLVARAKALPRNTADGDAVLREGLAMLTAGSELDED
jgi:KAP family P-loop domain